MPKQTECTPERTERICAALRSGNTRENSAKIGGIQPRAFYNWMAKGRAGLEPYVRFEQAVKEAESDAEAWHIANLVSHASTTWQVSAWWLERRNPTKWGRRDMSYERAKREERRAQGKALAEIPIEQLEAMVQAEKARRGVK
jgi:hypothetical protein